MITNKKAIKNRNGQSMVEFALILPILLLLVLATIQFGIIFSSQIAVTNAAREGARIAAVGGTNSEILSRVQNSLGGHVFLDPISTSNITVTPNPRTSADIGNEVKVLISNVTLDLFVPVPGIFTQNSEVALSGKASMRLEHIPDESSSTPPEEEEPTPPEEEEPTPPEIPEYDSTKTYNKDEKVRYNGKTYISLKDGNDKVPTNPGQWAEVVGN